MNVTIDPTSLTMIVDGVGFAISSWEGTLTPRDR